MIVIDDDSEAQLRHTLKEYLRAPGEMGGIRFRFPEEKIEPSRLHAELPELIRRETSAQEARLYFCEDGDVLILAPGLYPRDAHRLALNVAKAFDLSTLECGFNYYEMRDQAGKILATLEQKRVAFEMRRREEEEARRRRQEKQAQAIKRREILSGVSAEARELKEKRARRKAPEIMVIEDDAFSRRLVENILGRQYRVTGVGEPDRALPAYAQLAPDILFLDINLPDVSGHELLERLISMDPDAYVVMLSGNADRANVAQAMQRGAKGFVAKPFTPARLHHYIQRCHSTH